MNSITGSAAPLLRAGAIPTAPYYARNGSTAQQLYDAHDLGACFESPLSLSEWSNLLNGHGRLGE